ncbi:hypothetical protein MASR2M36_38790 [Providencia sp.]
MLPSAEEFSQAVSAMGIGNDTLVVIYSQNNLFSSPRAWWTFATMGCKDVKILAGGIDAWKDAGFDTQSGKFPQSKINISKLRAISTMPK